MYDDDDSYDDPWDRDDDPDEPPEGYYDPPDSWWRRHVVWRWYGLPVRAWLRNKLHPVRYDDEAPF